MYEGVCIPGRTKAYEAAIRAAENFLKFCNSRKGGMGQGMGDGVKHRATEANTGSS